VASHANPDFFADFQGVLIGMGLYMIDKTFCKPQPIDSHSSTPESPPHKRMRPPSETSSGGTTPVNVHNGTGYAGNGTEDVSWMPPLGAEELMSRHQVRRLLLKPRPRLISPPPKSCDKSRRTYQISTDKADPAFPTLWSILPLSPTSDGRVHSSMISYEMSLCST
jgi:hypothetical protein